MKRVIAFDFLRGVAIIVVLMLHVFQISYANRLMGLLDQLKDGTLTIGWYFVLPWLFVLGSSNGLFLMLSCASNGISVAKQWNRKVVNGNVPEKDAFKAIMKSQLVRGTVIYICGWVSEGVTASAVQYLMVVNAGREETYWKFFIEGFFWTNILHGIALSLVISSFIQLLYLWKGSSRKRFTIVLLAIATTVCLLQPALKWIVLETIGSQSFAWHDLFEASAGSIIARLLWLPFMGRIIPLFPFFSGGAIGLIYATFIAENAISKSFFKKMALLSLGIILIGVAFGAAIGDLELDDRARHVPWHMVLVGWENFALGLLLYLIDFRKKTNRVTFLRRTVFIRRYGIMTLTLWMLQYAIVGPALLLELATGWPIIGISPGEDYGMLNDWQVWILEAIVFLLFSILLRLWERANFMGSFEWMSARLMSGRSTSGDRMNLSKVLYESESMLAQGDDTQPLRLQKVQTAHVASQDNLEEDQVEHARLSSGRSNSNEEGNSPNPTEGLTQVVVRQ